MMSARSSESSLTIVLTVEYRIGLVHPAAPKRYHATNLQRNQQVTIIGADLYLLQTFWNIPNNHAQCRKHTACRSDSVNKP